MIHVDIRVSSSLAVVLVKYSQHFTRRLHLRNSGDLPTTLNMEEEYEDDAHDAPPQQQPVNLKRPPFWASNQEAWFGMVEGQFILRNITQDNLRFYYVLGALPESAVRGLGDLMRPVAVPRDDAAPAHHLPQHRTAEDRRCSPSLRHLIGTGKAGGARLPQVAGFRRHSRGGAPGSKGYSPLDISPFRLERHGGRRDRLDQGLPALPEG